MLSKYHSQMHQNTMPKQCMFETKFIVIERDMSDSDHVCRIIMRYLLNTITHRLDIK